MDDETPEDFIEPEQPVNDPEGGILHPVEKRLLWVFKTRVYPPTSGLEEAEVKSRLMTLLNNDEIPDTHDALLVGLLICWKGGWDQVGSTWRGGLLAGALVGLEFLFIAEGLQFSGEPTRFRGTTLNPMYAPEGSPTEVQWTIQDDGQRMAIAYAAHRSLGAEYAFVSSIGYQDVRGLSRRPTCT